MAAGKTNAPVLWSTNPSISVAANTTTTEAACDDFEWAGNDIDAVLQVNIAWDGTPTGTETVEVYIVESTGDVDGTAGDDFDTLGHARPLMVLDRGIEEPARTSRHIKATSKSFKLRVKNTSTTNSLTFRARVASQQI